MKTGLFRCRYFCSVFFWMVAAAWGQTPSISGVSNSASFAGGIAPGESISIFGSNLSTATTLCTSGGIAPTTCGNTQVLLNGNAIPLTFVSPTQVNAVAPFGLTGVTASIQVSTPGGQSSQIPLIVIPASPGILTQSGGPLGLFQTGGGTLITAASPASPGETLLGYAVGLGITNPAVADGTSAPSNPPASTAATVNVTVGGVPATVLFEGLAPGIVSIYQVNFVVPAGLLGNQPVVFTVDGIASNSATLPLAAGSPTAVSITSSSSLGTVPVGEVQVGLAATGGNGNYTWALVSGALPPGLSLRTDLPSYVASGGPTGLIGIATTPGTYNFTLSVTSGVSSIQQAFTMKITALTLMDGRDGGNRGGLLPDGFLGSAYYGTGYQLVATENGIPVAVTCTGTPPPGMSLSQSCLLSGTPAASGKNSFTVNCTNGTDTISQTLNLYAYPVQIGGPAVLPNATQGTSYNYALSASGGTGPYTYTVNGLPAGLTVTAGVISGTPTAAQGKHDISVTATDSQSHSYTKSLAIDILGAPELLPQILQYGDLWDCTIGMACSRGIGVYSGGVAPFTWNVTGLPPGMAFRYGDGITLYTINAGDVELWGTPTAMGTYNVTVTATDVDGASVTQTYPLRVSALFVDTSLPGGAVGTAYANTFRIVGGVPGYTVTQAPSRATPVGLPDGLAASGIAVTGTPQEGGQFYPLFLTADSAGTADTLTFSQSTYFNGVAGSSTTVGYYPTQYITEGQSFSLQVGACCAASYTWSQPSGTPPPGIGLSGSGLLSGMSSADGTYTFLVQATQTGTPANFGTRKLTLVVTPLAVTTAFALPNGFLTTPYNQTLAASGATGSLTWSLAPGAFLPPGLLLNPSTGAITGTPTAVGAYYFSVDLRDTAGHAGIGYFNLDTYSTPPVVNIASIHAGNFVSGESGATYLVTVSNAPGSAPTSVTVTVTETVPGGLSLVSMAGTGWTCPATGDNTCSRSDALYGGMSYPAIVVTVNVAAGTLGTVTNKVSVLAGAGPTVNADDPTTVSTFSLCDLNHDGSTNVSDIQKMISQALGAASAANDLNQDGAVNVVDVQIVLNAVLTLSCWAM